MEEDRELFNGQDHLLSPLEEKQISVPRQVFWLVASRSFAPSRNPWANSSGIVLGLYGLLTAASGLRRSFTGLPF